MTNNEHACKKKFAVLVFAWNESSVIQETVFNILQALRRSDALFVIADNCTDDTAMLARRAGAITIERYSKLKKGKGAALTWFVDMYKNQLLTYDSVIILDADNRVSAGFFEKLEGALTPEITVAQCLLSPTNIMDNPLSTLISLSELVEQTMFDRIRSTLGLSVRLRGTGMVFDPQILVELCPRISTEVEDIALSLLLAEKGVTIRQLRSTQVIDPKPIASAAASRQRARWFRGQWKAFWNYRFIVLLLLSRGPSGWSILNSLFLKPRWLKLVVFLAAGFILLRNTVISVFFFSIASVEILTILAGILCLSERWVYLKALVYIPLFIVMWMKGIILSLKHRPWLRARETLLEEEYRATLQKRSKI